MEQWIALGITLLLETPVAFVATLLPDGEAKRIHVILTCVGVNLVSHPVAWTAATTSFDDLLVKVTIIELLVVAFEALIYRLVADATWGRAAAIALVANAVSFFVGIFILSGF